MGRFWKEVYEHGDENDMPQYPKRVDLTERQKNWVKRVWSWAAVALMGLNVETVPDAIPRHSEDGRELFVPAVTPHIHHIRPIGESLRLDGRDDYNRPDNLAPVSARLHIGKGVRPGDEDEDMVIHKDTMEALRNYGEWARNGRDTINPMQLMHSDRSRKTEEGQIYHNDMWDEGLNDLTRTIIDKYRQEHPGDNFPPARKSL